MPNAALPVRQGFESWTGTSPPVPSGDGWTVVDESPYQITLLPYSGNESIVEERGGKCLKHLLGTAARYIKCEFETGDKLTAKLRFKVENDRVAITYLQTWLLQLWASDSYYITVRLGQGGSGAGYGIYVGLGDASALFATLTGQPGGLLGASLVTPGMWHDLTILLSGMQTSTIKVEGVWLDGFRLWLGFSCEWTRGWGSQPVTQLRAGAFGSADGAGALYLDEVEIYGELRPPGSDPTGLFERPSPRCVQVVPQNREDSVAVAVECHRSCAAKVEYGLTADYGETVQSSGNAYYHSFVLRNLVRGATYHYRVTLTNGTATRETGDRTFKTFRSPRTLGVSLPPELRDPENPDPWYAATEFMNTRVLLVADSHCNCGLSSVAFGAEARGPYDLVLMLGDNTNLYERGEFGSEVGFREAAANAFGPFMSLMRTSLLAVAGGNHDEDMEAHQGWALFHPGDAPWSMYTPYRSFNLGWAHYSILTMLSPGQMGDQQLNWLAEDLASAGDRWRIVAMHYPPCKYCDASQFYGEYPSDYAALMNILDAGGADLVLHGHVHSHAGYDRPVTGGSYLIVSLPAWSYGISVDAGKQAITGQGGKGPRHRSHVAYSYSGSGTSDYNGFGVLDVGPHEMSLKVYFTNAAVTALANRPALRGSYRIARRSKRTFRRWARPRVAERIFG